MRFIIIIIITFSYYKKKILFVAKANLIIKYDTELFVIDGKFKLCINLEPSIIKYSCKMKHRVPRTEGERPIEKNWLIFIRKPWSHIIYTIYFVD